MSDLRMDAGESIFFPRELEKIRSGTYDVKFKETKLLNILPISTEGDPDMPNITHRQYTRVGIAKMGGGNYATDFPRADVYGTEVTVKIKPVHMSYGYNMDEIRAAAKAGTGTTTTWSTKTSDQILADLNGIVNAITTATNGIEAPDIIAMPLTSYNLISQKRLSDYSEKSVMQYFLESNPNIQRIEWFTELETMGDSSTRRFVAWKNDPQHLVLDLPLQFEQLEVEKDGLEYVIPCRAKTAGVTVFYPLSACYGDGI